MVSVSALSLSTHPQEQPGSSAQMRAMVTQEQKWDQLLPPATSTGKAEKKRKEKNYRHGRLITVARNYRHEDEAGSAR